MLEVTDKSLRAPGAVPSRPRRARPIGRRLDGPCSRAIGPASSPPHLPRPAGGVSFLPLEEVHRPKPWLNYPAAAAKAMRPLARANRECSDCRVAFLSLSLFFSSSRRILVSYLSFSLFPHSLLSLFAHSFLILCITECFSPPFALFSFLLFSH